MAEQDSTEPPPPYSAPSRPETDPPPYSPPPEASSFNTNDTFVPQGAVHAAYPTYGTGNSPSAHDPKDTGNYPPGAPPFFSPEGAHMTSSTALLVSQERKPPSFFLVALMTCLCFSPLFGLLAIIFSCLSDSAWLAGDRESARRYSQVAMALSVVGIITSVFIVILIFTTGVVKFHYSE